MHGNNYFLGSIGMKELDQFYKERYEPYVKMLTRILQGNREDAEDLVQESFLRAYQFSATYDEDKGTVSTWFNSILFNCLRQFKTDQTQMVSLSSNDLSHEDVNTDVVSTPERRAYLRKLIGRVSNIEHRQVLEMFFVFGFTTREIEQLTDLTQTNITTIISRFRKGL